MAVLLLLFNHHSYYILLIRIFVCYVNALTLSTAFRSTCFAESVAIYCYFVILCAMMDVKDMGQSMGLPQPIMELSFEFCVFVTGWRHALRSEWPFIIIIIMEQCLVPSA